MTLIAAVDEKWGIGADGKLLSPIPEDLKFFREKTANSVVILGRKTLYTFPEGKPLKNRENVIVTRDRSFSQEGAETCHSVEEAAETAKKFGKNVFVVGGGSIYRQMLKYCDTAYITKIYKTFENADTFIENLDESSEWKVESESDLKEYGGLKFRFVTYKRL